MSQYFTYFGYFCVLRPSRQNKNDFLNFSENLSENERISLRIFDDVGHEIYFSEIYDHDWPSHSLPTGYYFFQVKSATRDESGVVFVQNE